MKAQQPYTNYQQVVTMIQQLSQEDKERLFDEIDSLMPTVIAEKEYDHTIVTPELACRIDIAREQIRNEQSTICRTHEEVIQHLNTL
ncbi:hypothetical protein FACS1894201_11510 [Bacteroidia bacterium]|nr:hypothetical protein FACS1894201_11510 [Bacteroidia bacterium]